MNDIYRVIWSAAKQTYVAVNEKTGTAASRGKAVKAVVTAVAVATAALAGAAGAEVLDTGDHDAVYYESNHLNDFFKPSGNKFTNGLELSEDKVLSGITGAATSAFVADGHSLTLAGEQVDLGNVNRLVVIGGSGLDQASVLQIGSTDGAKTTFAKKVNEIFVNMTEDGQGKFDKADKSGVMRVDNAALEIGTLHAGDDIVVGSTAEVTVDTIKSGLQSPYGGECLTNEGKLNVGTYESAVSQHVGGMRPFANGLFANNGTARIENFAATAVRIHNNKDLTIKTAVLSTGELSDGKAPSDTNLSVNKGSFVVEESLTLVKDNRIMNDAHLTGMLRNAQEGTVTVGKAEGANGVVNNNGVIMNEGAFNVNGTLNIGTEADHAGILINDKTLTAKNANVYGVFENHAGAEATFDNLTIHDAQAFDGPDANKEFFLLRQSGNKGTISANQMTVGALFSNDGTLKGLGENSALVLNEDFTNAGSGAEQGRIEGFDELTVAAGKTFTNYQTVAGIGNVTVNGKLYNVRAEGTDNLGSFGANTMTVGAGGTVVVGGVIELQDMTVNGTVTDQDTLHEGNKAGELRVEKALELNNGGSVALDNLTVGQVTVNGGQLDVDNLTIVGNNDAVSSLGTDATFKNLGVVENGRLEHAGALTVSERFTVENAVALSGKLDANRLAMSENGSLELNADGTIAEMEKGGLITLGNNTTLTVGKGSMAGSHLVFNTGASLDYQAGGFEGATLEYKNHNATIAKGEGYGKNHVILDKSTVTFENGAVLTKDATIELNEGSTIVAGAIDFTQGEGKLTMAGGTLETNFGQIFASVDSDGKLPAVDEDGNAVEIPMGGITGVGAVKDEIKQGIEYKSGTFAFADNGYTQSAVSNVITNLQTAFGSGISDATVAFNGQADADSKFDVAFIQGIQNNTNGLIFSNLVLDATGHNELIFGKADGEIAGNWGFKGIDTVESVTVKDDQKLILVGGTSEDYKVLEDSQQGGTINATDGTLQLGMSGADTMGMVDTVLGHVVVAGGKFAVNELGDNSQSSSATVLGGATLTIENLTAENNAVSVGKDGTLNLTNVTHALKSYENYGTVNAGALQIDGKFMNAGTLNAKSLESLNDVLSTSGTVNLTADEGADATTAILTGKSLNNDGTIKIVKGSASLTADLTNSGTIEALDGTINVAGKFTTTDGSVKAKELLATNGALIEGGLVEASVAAGTSFVTVNGGELRADAFAGDKLTIGEKGAVKVGALEGDTVLVNGGTLEFVDHDELVLVDPAQFTNTETGVVKGLKTLTFNVDGENAGRIELKEGGKLTVADGKKLTNSGAITGIETLVVNGTVKNLGELGVSGTTTLSQLGLIEQSDDAVFSTKNLVVDAAEFKGMSGTLKVEDGITFAGDAQVTVGEGSKELVLGAEGLNGEHAMTYKVTDGKVLTFGSEHALVDKLIAADDSIKGASGYLVADKTVTIGTNGKVVIGSEPTTRAGTPNLYVDGSSVTVVDASALTDGVAFKADKTKGDVTADIVDGAKVVVTRVEKDGDITLLDGFTMGDKTVDDKGVWIGGWTGEEAIYVNDGSGLDYDITTEFADGKLVANLQMADVSTVYTDLAIKDIANAALRKGQKGGDVTLVQNVIRNDKLTVAEKTEILNSASQIGATLGANANFFADATNLMATVEEHATVTNRDIGQTCLWVKAEGGKYKQDGLKLSGNMESGYDTNAFGFTFGADHAVAQNIRLGGAFSYLDGSADSDGHAVSGENDYETFGLQGYVAWNATDRVNLIGSLGWFHTSNDMTLKSPLFAGSKVTADADADALTFGIRAESAYDVAGFSVKPYAGLRAVYMMNDDYTTNVNGEAAFGNDVDNTFTLQMPIGVAVEKAFEAGSGWTVVPTVDVSVIPQFGDTDYDTTVTGAGTGVSQTLNADMAGDVLGRAKLGLHAVKDKADFSVSYGFTGGDAGREDHSFTLGVSYRF